MSDKAQKPTGVINIHGREYETVALRVKRFREARPDWAVVTEILHRDPEVVIMRATISDPAGRTLATGHAEEWRKASAINKTSAIENAETSAIGRALAALGMGGTEFATANEIEVAKRKEQVEPPRVPGMSATQVNAEAFDAMPDDAKQILREMAQEVQALVRAGDVVVAREKVQNECPEQEDKLALWFLLPSDVRSALKRQKEAA